jgi:hypothetical protein
MGDSLRREKTRIIVFLLLVTVLLTVLLPISGKSDGGVFIPNFERVIFLPEQKAVIFWDGTNETMILSTKIQSENFSNMAWIVPVPSKTIPEVSEGDIEIFDEIAFEFGEWVGGDYYISYDLCFIAAFIFFICLVGLIISLLKKDTKLFIPLLSLFIILFILSIIIGLFAFVDTMMLGAGDQIYDVEVIDIQKVDIYDVATLKATNATNLVGWLNDNDFIVPSSTIPVLQEYCNQSDFYFIVNKINVTNVYSTPEEIENATISLQDGIATPLQISFQPEQAFYPMKMSSIHEGHTIIDVYVISDSSVIDEVGDLIPKDVRYVRGGWIIPSFDVGYVITWLTYEGYTQDIVEDSYFLEME